MQYLSGGPVPRVEQLEIVRRVLQTAEQTCYPPLSSLADVMLVQPRVEFILSFIDHIAGDEDHTDGVVACAAGLIG